jgi:hypothetical protein
MADVNREYKDRLFKFIFGNPANKVWTLSLYNAIRGSAYTDPEAISFNTIEDAVYMGMKNDVSFIISSDMELWEHQSTFNPNMPMRFLLYSGDLYDKYIKSSSYYEYSSLIQNIPAPRCVCFYNGMRDEPESSVLRLSDAYEGDGDIEVLVTMLNINYGKNKALMEACRPLREYAWFIDRVRTLQKDKNDLKAAVYTTIDQMPENYMIKPFLLDNRSEVMKMVLTEYDQEKTIEKAVDEGRREGRDEGIEIGLEKGRDERNVEVATELLQDGGHTVSFISRISKLPESAIRKLADKLHVTAL